MSNDSENNAWGDTGESVIEGDAPSVALVSSIYATFWDFLMEPIEGLVYSIHVGDRQATGTTGSDGKAVPILGVTPGDDVQVYVRHKYDGEYKYIGSTTAPAGDYPLAIVSPKVLTEIETEPHEGAPGTVAAPAITSQSARTKVRAEPKVDRKLTTGRNDKGHPLAVSKHCPEWLERNLPAVCNLWTWADFQGAKPTPPAKADPSKAKAISKKKPEQAPTHADARVFRNGTWGVDTMLAGLFGAKPKPIAGLDEKDSVKLRMLIEFAERQVKIKYPFPGITSVEIQSKYAKQPAKAPTEIFSESKENVSIERCLPYVKIALWRSGYVQGVTSTIPAKDSGKDWEAFGFKNISSTLPQVEITYETKSGTVKHLQPDISYTAPGDVIVYDQVGAPSAYGHIDIRTYHGFVSDFQWGVYPKLGGVRGKYRVVGVYRKASDEMALVRVRAFLRILREMETEGYSDADSYFVLPDAKDPASGKVSRRKFTNTATHPFSDDAPIKYDQKDYAGKKNTAAGAYQIKIDSWKETLLAMGWPKVFSSEMQNRIAMYRLQYRKSGLAHPRRTALGYIMEGEVEKAVNETSLWDEWACLPGGPHKAKITLEKLKAKFADFVGKNTK